MRAVAVVTIAAVLAGCATIMGGGPAQIPVYTNPPGAFVYVNGQPVGQTPTTVVLDSHVDVVQLQIYLPGFQPVVLTRSKSINLWVIGNIFFIFGILVDAVTGAWTTHDDGAIAIGLTPAGPPPQYQQPPQPGYPPQQQPYQPQ